MSTLRAPMIKRLAIVAFAAAGQSSPGATRWLPAIVLLLAGGYVATQMVE